MCAIAQPAHRGEATTRWLTHADESERLLCMMKRLQVLLEEDELAEIKETARRQRLTTAAWVREALRHARETGSHPGARRKLRVIRDSAGHAFPIADIETMLGEIESGYRPDPPR